MFLMDGLIPLLMPLSCLATESCRARQGVMNSLKSLNCLCEVIYPSPQSLFDTSTPSMGLPVCVVLAGYSLGTGLLYLVLGRSIAMQCTLSALSLR
jgi:hypothetical protein